MKKTFRFGITGLAFAILCAAQTNPQLPDVVSRNAATAALTAGAVDDTIRGSGTASSLPLFTSPRVLGNSVIVQNSSGAISIGGASVGDAKLAVAGGITASGAVSGTQYNLGANQLIAAPGGHNMFVGIGAGRDNHGGANSFFGLNAGGGGNSGHENAAFGVNAGASNTTGGNNAFFGSFAGQFNSAGLGNSYIGSNAGVNNNGSQNAFFGHGAGQAFSGGNGNTLLGAGTGATDGVSNATAIGIGAFATKSNTLILGGVPGFNGGAEVSVGIGTNDPHAKLEVGGDVFLSGTNSAIIMRITGSNFLCAKLVINHQLQILVTSVTCPGDTGTGF